MTIHAERDISYVLVSDGIQIGDGSGSCLSDLSRIEKLTIPDVYEEDNKKVVSIGQYAFGKNNVYQCNIGELILSENLLIIDSFAFSSSIIDNIIFPNSLNEVKEAAFDSAILKNISFENCNENIFIKSFHHFRWATITNIVLPKTIKIISTGFFWGANVKNFHIPASVIRINEKAFAYMHYIGKITSDSPNYIVHNGILYSSDYRSLIKYPSDSIIDILPTVTQILDYGGFSGLSSEKFVLKNKLRRLGDASFAYCSSLISCDLSSSIATEIPGGFFYGDSKLEKVILPKAITTLNEVIFESCTSLKSIILPINLRSTNANLGKYFTLDNIYYCGVNNLNINFAGNPNIHVTSDYPYDTFLNRQVKDRSYICEEPHKSFLYDPREIICTQRQIYYSSHFSFFMIYVIIILEDEK